MPQSVRFRERTDLLDFLLEVSTITSETLDLDDLLSNIGSIVRQVIPYDLFGIFLYNERSKELRLRYGVGHREEVARNLAIPLGEGLVGTAAAKREAILVPDVFADERYLQVTEVVRSELVVPMIARNRLVGVIDVQSAQASAFGDNDRTMLGLIATRVASVIDNARLYRRAERQFRTLQTLSRVSTEISSILDLDQLLTRIATRVRGIINYDAFSILLLDPAENLLRHRFSIRHDQRVRIDNVPMGKGITGAAAVAREAVRVDDTSTDPRYIMSHEDIRSELAVPLILRDRVIGVMDLESDRVGYFTEDHARTMSLLAPSVASAVENARLYEEINIREKHLQDDLEAAFELQTVLLPREAPAISGLEVAIGMRPARTISGDLFDFFEHSDGNVQIAFGDSSGKGAAAALYGAMVIGQLRSVAGRRRGPAEQLRALNDALMERKVEGRYVTLLLTVWHHSTRTFTFGNAGGTPPMILRKGEVLDLTVEGVPLGLLPNREYDVRQFHAKSGDLIVLASDGVTDQQNPEGEDFGRMRFGKTLKKCFKCPAADVVTRVFADLDEFNEERFDDQTLIVMRVQ